MSRHTKVVLVITGLCMASAVVLIGVPGSLVGAGLMELFPHPMRQKVYDLGPGAMGFFWLYGLIWPIGILVGDWISARLKTENRIIRSLVFVLVIVLWSFGLALAFVSTV